MRIFIKKINKSYQNGIDIFKNFSQEIPKGSLFILKGRSGKGKTTLLNMISGLIKPNSGEIIIDKTVINKLSESKRDRFRAKNIGYIFQTFNLITPLKVIENIVLPLKINKKKFDQDKVDKLLKRLEIYQLKDRYPYQLSIGQKQRVAIARTLLSQPPIVLADEPTASLDTESAKMVKDEILNINKNGSTVIIVSHDQIFDDSGAQFIDI